MALEHLLFFGWVEAIVTMGIVAALAKSQPELLEMKPAARPLRWLWAGMGVLILLTPIGVLAPGTAWGEWGGEELEARWSATCPRISRSSEASGRPRCPTTPLRG